MMPKVLTKAHVAAIAGFALVAVPANAALRLFFATVGVAENAEFTAPVSVPRSNPTVLSGSRLYLWAEMIAGPSNQMWSSLAFDVIVNDGTVTARSLYNYTVPDPNGLPGEPPIFSRWQGGTPGVIQANGSVIGAHVATVDAGYGISNSNVAALYDNQSEIGPINAGTSTARRALPKAVLLGYYDVAFEPGAAPFASIFLRVGANNEIQRNGQSEPESIYFGVGDEDSGILGNSYGRTSLLADATVTPEPASAILLILAAMARHRR